MRALDPTPEEALPTEGWRLRAVDAGRYPQGLQSTIQTWNSSLQTTALLLLAAPATWEPYTRKEAKLAGCKRKQVHDALLTLTVAVEGLLREGPEGEEDTRVSQSTMLVQVAAEAELFHTPSADGETYAVIPIKEHREVWPLKAKGFRAWMAHQCYDQHGKNPSTQSVQDALLTLSGKALFKSPEHRVYTRLAEHDGAIYLDLANNRWEAVEITAGHPDWHRGTGHARRSARPRHYPLLALHPRAAAAARSRHLAGLRA